MPRTEQAARLTDAYRAQLLTIRQRAVALTATRWQQQISADDLDGTFETWQATIAAMLLAAQRTGVNISDAYLAAYLAAELDRPVQPTGVDADRWTGEDQAGQPLEKALLGALITTKIAIAQGRRRDEALAMGRNRAVRTVATESLAVPKAALGDLMADSEHVKGWRRVAAAGACGACLASTTGAVETKRAQLKQHRFCRCVREGVVVGVRETIRRPTGREMFDRLSPAEQAVLFDGRGGEEKAALVRSGAVPFDALIARTPLASEPDGITEIPLRDLAALAA